jgi:hypothetical protein
MNTTITALVLIAALATMLVLSPVLAGLDDAFAKRGSKNQVSVQSNFCGGSNNNCQNGNSQIQGKRNNVLIIGIQH